MKRINWQNNFNNLPVLLRKIQGKVHWPDMKTLVLLMLVGGVILSSCQAPVAPATSQTTPKPPATPTPASQPAPVPAVTVPVTPQIAPVDRDKPVIIEFGKSLNTLNKDWEAYRRAYGDWRQKVACAEPSMTESLSKFVASFQKIKRTVNELPRSSLVRSVVEKLVEAADKEEAALIELRANWKPGDDTAFQKFEANRLEAGRIRRQADQNLNDLTSAIQTENIELLDKYSRARTAIEADWDTLQKEYDGWRQSLPANSKTKDPEKEKAAISALQKLADNAQNILNRLYALTPPTLVRRSADLLVDAAEKEEAALRKLKASWKPGDEESLATYERERLAVNKIRRDSELGLEGVLSASIQGNKTFIQQFATSYGQVSKTWDDFRSQYDDWRNKGGECDSNTIRQQVSDQVNTFHTLALRVNALPQQTVVRPLAELMTQAAEREETALRLLRDSWKAYDSSYYQNYEKEWVNIDRLRRQAFAGLTDLMQKNNISPSDIGQ